VSHVFHRTTADGLPIAVRGDGIYIVDSAGRRYLDASGGAAVSCLGHSHPKVVAAVQEQVARLPFAHTGFFTNEPMEELADLLIEAAPAGLEKVYYVSGGSEATEAALKLARQYFVEIGQPGRRHLITRRQSYHGNTLGALAAGGNQFRRAPFDPLLIEATQVAPCYAFRDRRPDETEEAYGRRAADEVEGAILARGPETVMAFIAETIVGGTAGAVPPVPGYFRRVREICDRHGVLLILDEVMCGMGRTGVFYACADEEVSPDILTIAKGLGGGYQPIGAMLVSGRIFEAFRKGSGAFIHGHTYLGHATACAAALAVQHAIREENLLDNVRRRGAALRAALEDRFGNHHHVGDIRGRGLFLALEFVADRASKEPFDPSMRLHARVKQAAMSNGLICYPMGGTIDGRRGDHVIIAPPFIIDSADVEEIVARLGRSVDAALGQMAP
jgi:adenosylmethionine-8-amino-7-oxononanoate aminotransferase